MPKHYGLRIRVIAMGAHEAREQESELITRPTAADFELLMEGIRTAILNVRRQQQEAVDRARQQVDARYDPEAGRG